MEIGDRSFAVKNVRCAQGFEIVRIGYRGGCDDGAEAGDFGELNDWCDNMNKVSISQLLQELTPAGDKTVNVPDWPTVEAPPRTIMGVPL